MHWQKAIEAGLFAKLKASGSLVALVGTRIFNELAPVDTPRPFVIYMLNSGKESNEQGERLATCTHTVLGVAASAGEAANIQSAIDEALHEQTFTPGSGWAFVDCKLMTPVSYVEEVDRNQFFKRGGNYRTRVSEEQA